MDEDDECIHGLGPKSACTICNGREAKEREDTTATFASSFRSMCRVCKQPIAVGDEITGHVGSGIPFVHAECWEAR